MTTPAQSVPAGKLRRSARSDEIVARHRKYLWPSVINYFHQPLVADHGEMLTATSTSTFSAASSPVSVGQGNPKVSGKVAAQVHLRGAKLNLNGWYHGFVRHRVIRRFPQYRRTFSGFTGLGRGIGFLGDLLVRFGARASGGVQPVPFPREWFGYGL